MPSKADMQQRLNELSSIVDEQAAQIEALEKRAACAEEELAKAKRTKKGNEVSHSQPQSLQTAVLSEAERLTRHLLVDSRRWDILECFRASRMVKDRFSAGCVRIAFDLLAENVTVDLPVCSYEEYERLRFSHGLPVIGREFGVGAIPNETDLLGLAVSFDKGCYRGQELVERIAARKGGRRLLRRIRSDVTLSPKEDLFSQDKEAGEVLAVTSTPPYIGFASVLSEVEGIKNEQGVDIEVFPLNEVIQ